MLHVKKITIRQRPFIGLIEKSAQKKTAHLVKYAVDICSV